ncbi:MAG TPA: hypothetical protein VGB03_07135 [Acidimicrobiales bacterium]|jgi:hypothetical protein
MGRDRWFVVVGLLTALGAVVLWFALGGFQLPGYGGMTAEQDAAASRAWSIAFPLLVVGVIVLAVGVNRRITGRKR